MLPFNKILFPTDFSDSSYEALKAANELAQHFNAELIVAHVVPPIPVFPVDVVTPNAPEFNVAEYENELVARSEKLLDTVIRERVPEDVRCRNVLIQGEAAACIVKLAEDEKVDIIVIATHGRTGWRRFLFGSVAEKVVRLAPSPVLTIQVSHEGND